MPRLAFFLLLALGLAACDAGEDDQPGEPLPGPGSFRASVSFDDGDRLDLSGLATASTVRLFFDSLFVPGDSLATPDSSTSFMITLVDGTPGPGQPSRTISFTWRDVERPAPGTYPVGGFGRDGVFASFSTFDGGSGSFLFAESGTITVETSTEERTAGSFSFRAGFTLLDGGRRRAEVRGSFDARDLGPFGGDGSGYTPLVP